MSKIRRLLHLVPFALMLLIMGVGALGAPPSTARFSISVPRLAIARGERVVGFEFHVRSGRIAQLPNTPIGWSITVDNDPSWNTTVKGTITVAAAAVGSSFFRNCLILERNDGLGNPLAIRGEIIVTHDFVKNRRIPVSMRDIVLKRLTR